MNHQNMTWGAFKAALEQHPEHVLQFQYADAQWVSPSYHITEVKQAPITSVDCGGVMNAWTEVVVQLWEPSASEADRAMNVSKAMKIFHLVESKLALNAQAIVKIEFGNSVFDTRQMLPAAIEVTGENLVVDLRADATQCKALNRGDSCGKPEPSSLQVITSADACCTPGGGCC
ncbi:DUF6428 family protein [Chitinophaga deserti]|uniref:DUF6428 family protein n=1 Tax=Chitinophaga deserti TaxID=2164099 RepID=UPI000D6D52B7|nr:DUF6428 family protein [Chitinophaga deserti]